MTTVPVEDVLVEEKLESVVIEHLVEEPVEKEEVPIRNDRIPYDPIGAVESYLDGPTAFDYMEEDLPSTPELPTVNPIINNEPIVVDNWVYSRQFWG